MHGGVNMLTYSRVKKVNGHRMRDQHSAWPLTFLTQLCNELLFRTCCISIRAHGFDE